MTGNLVATNPVTNSDFSVQLNPRFWLDGGTEATNGCTRCFNAWVAAFQESSVSVNEGLVIRLGELGHISVPSHPPVNGSSAGLHVNCGEYQNTDQPGAKVVALGNAAETGYWNSNMNGWKINTDDTISPVVNGVAKDAFAIGWGQFRHGSCTNNFETYLQPTLELRSQAGVILFRFTSHQPLPPVFPPLLPSLPPSPGLPPFAPCTEMVPAVFTVADKDYRCNRGPCTCAFILQNWRRPPGVTWPPLTEVEYCNTMVHIGLGHVFLPGTAPKVPIYTICPVACASHGVGPCAPPGPPAPPTPPSPTLSACSSEVDGDLRLNGVLLSHPAYTSEGFSNETCAAFMPYLATTAAGGVAAACATGRPSTTQLLMTVLRVQWDNTSPAL
jgi:hypothetical protein